MKILLTWVTGYIGKRLLPVLLDKGHWMFCIVLDESRFDNMVDRREYRLVLCQLALGNPDFNR